MPSPLRKLPQITLFSLAGALAVLQLPVLPPLRWLSLLGVLAVAVLPGWRYRGPGDRWRLPVAALLFGALLAAWPAARWQEQRLPQACERQKLQLVGVVQGLAQRFGGYGAGVYRVELAVESLSPAACRGPQRLRVYLPVERVEDVYGGQLQRRNQLQFRDQAPAAGDRLTLELRLRQPWGRVNPAQRDGEKPFLLARIHALGSASGILALERPTRLTLPDAISRLRASESRWLRTQLGSEIGGLLAALAVGDRRFIEPAAWERLRRYGLTHLLVISGMHVSLLALPGFALGTVLGRLLTLRRPAGRLVMALPPLLAFVPAAAYAVLAGLSLPTQRALAMLSLGLLLLLSGRPVAADRVLALVALLLLILDPLSVLGASYWLSLGAVALLLWFTRWNRKSRGLRQAAGMQLYMLLAMLPISIFWFAAAGGIGGLLNLVAVPLVTLLVLPALLLALLARSVSEPLGELLLTAAARPFEMLWFAMVHWDPLLLQVPAAVAAPSLWRLALAVFAVALLALPVWRVRVLAVLLLLLTLRAPSPVPAAELRMVFLDVGQGTAVLLANAGNVLVYDTAGGPPGGLPIAQRSLLPELRARGIQDLEFLVISHPDQDHAAGEALVIAATPPRLVRRGVTSRRRERCRPGEQHRLGPGVRLQILSMQLPGDRDNNASCVVLVHAWGRRILLPGDVDSRRERALVAYWGAQLRADVLMSAHHGSASSNSRLWLRTVDPAMVVVSAGRANRFGHPAVATREAVAREGAALLTTAAAGAIELRVTPDGRLHCRRSRHRGSPFWRRGPYPRRC